MRIEKISKGIKGGKKRNKLKYVSFAIILSILLLNMPMLTCATTLGTLQKNQVSSVRAGETAKFTILFWNGENPINISLTPAEQPKNWEAIVKPNEFTLSEDFIESSNYEYVARNGEYVKALPVEVYVRVPRSATAGEYTVAINARAGNPGNGISVLIDKTFNLKVKILSFAFEGEAEESDLTKRITDALKGITGFFDLPENQYLTIPTLILSVIALMALRRLFKRRKRKLTKSTEDKLSEINGEKIKKKVGVRYFYVCQNCGHALDESQSGKLRSRSDELQEVCPICGSLIQKYRNWKADFQKAEEINEVWTRGWDE